MVQRGEGRPTLDADEAKAMRLLLTHQAVDVEVGALTEVSHRRPWPYHPGDGDRADWPQVPTVELRVARRLAKAGYVTITPGATVELTDDGVTAAEEATRGQ